MRRRSLRLGLIVLQVGAQGDSHIDIFANPFYYIIMYFSLFNAVGIITTRPFKYRGVNLYLIYEMCEKHCFLGVYWVEKYTFIKSEYPSGSGDRRGCRYSVPAEWSPQPAVEISLKPPPGSALQPQDYPGT